MSKKIAENKKLVTLIALCAVVIVLAVLLIVAKNTGNDTDVPPENDTGDISVVHTPEKESEKVFPSLTAMQDISRFSLYKGTSLEYTLVYNTDLNEFLLEGYEHMLYNESLETAIATAFSLEITGTIDDPISFEEYSVSPESAKYTLELVDKFGKSYLVYIGAPLLSGEGYYARSAEADSVFYVSNTAALLFADDNSFLSGQLADPLEASKYHYTESFTLYKDMAPFVSIRFVPENEREAGDAYGYYQMTYPGEYGVEDFKYDAALKSLICPMADSVVTTELTEANFEKYGLSNPSFVVDYTLDGKTRTLYFGKRTNDGSMIYVMSDYGFIGLAVVAERFPFLDYELVDYINPYIFGLNINYVSSLAVSCDDATEKYILSGEGDNLAVRNETLGQITQTQNFRNFYRDLLMLGMKGYAQNTHTEDITPILSVVLETTGGKVYDYKFYHTAERECFYTVNSKGEFYTDIKDIQKIISDSHKLSSGETINPDVDY